MATPKSGQTVHLLNFRDLLRLKWKMDGRNARELELYTTDDLRRLYQTTNEDLISLHDGIVSRAELVTVIRLRVFWERFRYCVLFSVTLIAAAAGIVAAWEGRK